MKPDLICLLFSFAKRSFNEQRYVKFGDEIDIYKEAAFASGYIPDYLLWAWQYGGQ